MVVVTAVVAFVTTNLDDLLMLMLLFAHGTATSHRRSIWLGQVLGIGVLTAVGLAAAFGLGHLPGQYLRLLGLVPILLALRLLVKREEETPMAALTTWSVALLTLSGGGDNIGVYIPLFAGRAPGALALVAVLFLALTALWCLMGQKLAQIPRVAPILRRHSRWLVPAVFVVLGLSILLDGVVL